MAFTSKDLLVSILAAEDTGTGCPEFTITPCTTGTACPTMVSAGIDSAAPDGLALLQQQLRTALGQPAA